VAALRYPTPYASVGFCSDVKSFSIFYLQDSDSSSTSSSSSSSSNHSMENRENGGGLENGQNYGSFQDLCKNLVSKKITSKSDRDIIRLIGEFHDQGDAKWIAIKRSLWSHNDTTRRRPAPGQPAPRRPAPGRPAPGRPAPDRPIGRLGSGHSQGVIGVFSYY
jgi:hypothetical protein